MQFVYGLFSFIKRIYGEGHDVDLFLLELLDICLKVGQLPIAVRSPAAAVEDQHRVFTGQILRQMECLAVYQVNTVFREDIAHI
jgi:hypothetical protein